MSVLRPRRLCPTHVVPAAGYICALTCLFAICNFLWCPPPPSLCPRGTLSQGAVGVRAVSVWPIFHLEPNVLMHQEAKCERSCPSACHNSLQHPAGPAVA